MLPARCLATAAGESLRCPGRGGVIEILWMSGKSLILNCEDHRVDRPDTKSMIC